MSSKLGCGLVKSKIFFACTLLEKILPVTNIKNKSFAQNEETDQNFIFCVFIRCLLFAEQFCWVDRLSKSEKNSRDLFFSLLQSEIMNWKIFRKKMEILQFLPWNLRRKFQVISNVQQVLHQSHVQEAHRSNDCHFSKPVLKTSSQSLWLKVKWN